MNLKWSYWYYKSAIPAKICDDIIKKGLLVKDSIATTGGFEKINNKNIKKLKKIRNSNVVFLNDSWIYKELTPFIHDANKNAGWNFHIDFHENAQFTKYKKNQHYEWHQDSWEEPYKNQEDIRQNGKIRKLSMICQLVDGREYEGGELQFAINKQGPENKYNIINCNEILTKGSIVVFPSFVWHRVKPVTKGTRHSIVMWSLGNPYI